MKKNENSGFGIVTLILVLVLVLILGIMGYRTFTKDNTQSSTTNNASTNSDECGNDRQCFYQAFVSNCTQKTILTTVSTVEGDPITTSAEITKGNEICKVEITVDGSQDKFGDGKIHDYTCEKLVLENQSLTASQCTGSTQATSVNI